MKTITFDKTSAGWHKHVELNEHFLTLQKAYIIEKLSCRGYLYLNEVYESLGVEWDPHNENAVWIDKEHEFEITHELTGDNTFTIKVE